jgi:UDP-N-acetylglucosamine enolpyruvyl transferase
MRATIVLLGALLARFGQARVPRPGGDDIGARRVEQHLRGLRQMGAQVLAAWFISGLPELGGADKIRNLDVPVRTLISFEGH